MATVTSAPPPPRFHASMLIYDRRYRSYTFQFIALLVLIGLMAFLGWNLVRNLEALGQDISWGFLGQPSHYDINQRPIPYSSQDTHFRASIVGVLNTLIVSFLACATATVLGVAAGVLRLSNNWLVARLMSFYVEIFRNVPVLIWILIIFFVMIAVLPTPRAFRGDEPEASMLLGAVAFTNRGIYIPAPVWGAGSGIVLSVLGLSVVAAIAYRRYARKLLYDTGTLLPMLWPTIAIVIVPALAAQWVLGSPVTFDYPELRGLNFQGGFHLRGSLVALWFALAIYTGAFIAENVRAGIQAVPRGQTEAAASLGLRPDRIMNLIILPQALRVIIPPLISQYLNITKNSSLAIAVGYMDITGTLGGITLNQTGRAIEAILLLMLFYLTISLAISAVMNVYNRAVAIKER